MRTAAERERERPDMAAFRLPVIFLVLCLTVRVSGSCTVSADCQNGGTCEGGVCKCAPGYAGAICDTQGVCTDGGDECANGGTCVTSPIPTTCTCAEGYTGATCETDIDECTAVGDDAHDCDTNAACTNTPPGSYTCTCNDGFDGNGKTCNDIDECKATGDDAHTCDTNAACTNTPPGSYTCTCNEGFAGNGKTCNEGVCSDGGNECINGGTCVTSTTPTTCTCAEGYTGDTCQNDGDTVKTSTFLMTLTVLTFFVIL